MQLFSHSSLNFPLQLPLHTAASNIAQAICRQHDAAPGFEALLLIGDGARMRRVVRSGPCVLRCPASSKITSRHQGSRTCAKVYAM